MNIHIRPAQASDAEAVAPLLYSSGPAALDYVFGPRDADRVLGFLRWAFADGAGEIGFRRHVVAEVDGEAAGLGASFCGRDMTRLMIAGVRQIMTFYGPVSGARVIRRAMQIGRVVQAPKGNQHCIAHLGVAPRLRGKGIGALLIHHLLDEGRRLGRTHAVLDVSTENPRARALYERLGFRVAGERISTLRDGDIVVPNHLRMECPITSGRAGG